ncbi:kelch domain-containing protein 8B-like [Dendronephthya gigantea]|uniref:kelch domain-containing protein 8B-like n=1 Tax=Dendronephthya gigantea TaxID=151771 RepID=UPI00106C4131|nr:kelch domain-containing protein 8B-like [Dendronephthya gigantea]
MKQCPLRWTMFDGNLPAKLRGHAALVYEDKLISIGGFNEDKNMISDAIYETALIPPHTSRLLTRMKEPRYEHRAEIVNGKVFILGGSTTESYEDATDGVVVYDLVENNFTPCPSLPKPVFEMSTVIWGDKIIVLGGLDNNGRILDDVIIYETETGQSRWLPSMINKRSGSCAVIMNDVIIVFGGRNDEQGCLNSVETFTIGGDGWKELPGMIEKRWNATAVVKPHI